MTTASWRVFASGLVCVTALAEVAAADFFGSGPNGFEIRFVTIGEPGNPDDTTGFPNPAGAVATSFRIGKFEISEEMVDKANAAGGLGLTHNNRGASKPATSISWLEAAEFVNWLNKSTGHAPAYQFDGGGELERWAPGDPEFDPANPYRSSLARYFLPTVDEWYKAAYYDPVADVYYDFPTGSNSPPASVAGGTAPGTAIYDQPAPADIMQAGGLSPFGTMAQGGNANEWLETPDPNSVFYNAFRGGWWRPGPPRGILMMSVDLWGFGRRTDAIEVRGFRVASLVPEPATIAPAAIAAAALLLRRFRSERRRAAATK